MDFDELNEESLVRLRDRLQELHTGIANKRISVGEMNGANFAIEIKDERLEDLIWTLFIETHNELCNRFKNPIKLVQE